MLINHSGNRTRSVCSIVEVGLLSRQYSSKKLCRNVRKGGVTYFLGVLKYVFNFTRRQQWFPCAVKA